MKKKIAYLFYLIGLLFAVTSIASGASQGLVGAIYGAAGALAAWWIAAGIGLRLGTTPSQFGMSLKHFLGFDAEEEADVDPTVAPRPDHDR